MAQDSAGLNSFTELAGVDRALSDWPGGLREYQVGTAYVDAVFRHAYSCWVQPKTQSDATFEYLVPQRTPSELLWLGRANWGAPGTRHRRRIGEFFESYVQLDRLAFADVSDLIEYLVDYDIIQQEREAAGTTNNPGHQVVIEDRSENIELPSEVEHLQAQAAHLGAIANIHSQIESLNEKLQESVDQARGASVSWGRIGRTLGITSQAAMRRYDAEARSKHLNYNRKGI